MRTRVSLRLLLLTFFIFGNLAFADDNDGELTPTARLYQAVDALFESQTVVANDLQKRFLKCGGEMAQLEAEGRTLETFRLPYAVFAGQLRLLRAEILSLIKLIEKEKEDEKELDVESIQNEWLIRRIVWRANALLPLMRELSRNSSVQRAFAKYESDINHTTRVANYVLQVRLTSSYEDAYSTWLTVYWDLSMLQKELKTIELKWVDDPTRENVRTAQKGLAALVDRYSKDRLFSLKRVRAVTNRLPEVNEALAATYAGISELAHEAFGQVKEFDNYVLPLGRNEFLASGVVALKKVLPKQ